jgi:hypothetical protein
MLSQFVPRFSPDDSQPSSSMKFHSATTTDTSCQTTRSLSPHLNYYYVYDEPWYLEVMPVAAGDVETAGQIGSISSDAPPLDSCNNWEDQVQSQLTGTGSSIQHLVDYQVSHSWENTAVDERWVDFNDRLTRCCGSGMFNSRSGSNHFLILDLHENWSAIFFLASYAFRSKVLVLIKKIRDPEKNHPGSRG